MAKGVRRKAGWSTAQMAIVDRLFVYGTLRSGQAARSLIANYVVASQPARAPGRIVALADGYPGFIPGGEAQVIGEIVTLHELAAAFALLDAYEGEEFTRTMHQVNGEDGSRLWTWVYLLSDLRLADDAEPIAGGDWARYVSGT